MIIVRDAREEDLSGIRIVYAPYLDEEWLADRMGNVEAALQDQLQVPVTYLVAESGGEIEGVAAFKEANPRLVRFAHSDSPIEIYQMFALRRTPGVGRALVEEVERRTRERGMTDIVVYSAKPWSASWGFYDAMGFERAGNLEGGDGQAQVFRKILSSDE